MKNKKLVATVASLCLVVVAVVAAVVGVFAAVTQYTSASVSVTYKARDVYANVSLRSLGPVGTPNTTEAASRALTLSSAQSKHFNPTANQAIEAFTQEVHAYGWQDNQGLSSGVKNQSTTAEFYGYSLYEFKFHNQSTLNNMTVTLTATNSFQNAAVKYYTYQDSTDTTAPLANDVAGFKALIHDAEWGDDGSLDEDFGLNTASVASATLSITVDATESYYVYILVGLSSAVLDISGNLGLEFSLASVRPVQNP